VCLQIFASKRRFRAKKPNQFNAPRPPDRPKYALRPQTQARATSEAEVHLPAPGVIEIELPRRGRLRISGRIDPAVVTAALRALVRR
jgi:hypothetical protein